MTGSGSRHVWRRRLMAGLVVIAPVGVTVFVLWWIFQLVDGLLGRFLYPAIGRPIPGLGLLALLLLLLLVGWTAERTVGARVLGWWHTLLERLPLTRRVYSASSKAFRTMLSGERRSFRDVVLLEYPSPGRWTVGFVTSRAPAMMHRQVPDGLTVFVPTTPNPTSGYLVIVPREETVRLPMTPQEAFTFILSFGSVIPDVEQGPSPEALGLERQAGRSGSRKRSST